MHDEPGFKLEPGELVFDFDDFFDLSDPRLRVGIVIGPSPFSQARRRHWHDEASFVVRQSARTLYVSWAWTIPVDPSRRALWMAAASRFHNGGEMLRIRAVLGEAGP